MVKIAQKEECCGCTACAAVCPQECIRMERDAEGFAYPQVAMETCIECGLCEKVCPFLHPYGGSEPSGVFACKNKNHTVRMNSSSGGVFSLLAEGILHLGGVVFGAALNGHTVEHRAVQTISELGALRGSKYVQSEIGDAYQEAKELLAAGRWVLFSGTPCQISALRHFLAKPYEECKHLLCVDIVCHGVPSPRVFEKYCIQLEEQHNAKLSKVSFRDKGLGWNTSSFRCEFEDGQMLTSNSLKNGYMLGFLSDLYLRPSCYACKSNRFTSGSDLTLADYWGAAAKFPAFDDDKGISVVFVNSSAGKRIFESLSSEMEVLATELSHVALQNPCLYSSAKPHRNRSIFFAQFAQFEDKDVACWAKTCVKRSTAEFFRDCVQGVRRRLLK